MHISLYNNNKRQINEQLWIIYKLPDTSCVEKTIMSVLLLCGREMRGTTNTDVLTIYHVAGEKLEKWQWYCEATQQPLLIQPHLVKEKVMIVHYSIYARRSYFNDLSSFVSQHNAISQDRCKIKINKVLWGSQSQCTCTTVCMKSSILPFISLTTYWKNKM